MYVHVHVLDLGHVDSACDHSDSLQLPILHFIIPFYINHCPFETFNDGYCVNVCTLC